jgi:hypothetical protein
MLDIYDYILIEMLNIIKINWALLRYTEHYSFILISVDILRDI